MTTGETGKPDRMREPLGGNLGAFGMLLPFCARKAYTGLMKQPEGPTTRKHYARGYQAAMLDLLRADTEGGAERVRDWVYDNASRDTLDKYNAQPTFD
jgi:hypothetical protein